MHSTLFISYCTLNVAIVTEVLLEPVVPRASSVLLTQLGVEPIATTHLSSGAKRGLRSFESISW